MNEQWIIAYDEDGKETWRLPYYDGKPLAGPEIQEKIEQAHRLVSSDGMIVFKDRSRTPEYVGALGVVSAVEATADPLYDPHGIEAQAAASLGIRPFAIKDSGVREEVPGTGMVRDTRIGKGRYDLLPPDAMRRLAQHYEGGAEKYGPHNWEKGGPLSRYVDSMLRHAFAVVAGQTDEDHVIAVAWNAMAIADHQEKIKRGELPADLDDVFAR